jgi:hypothetical protein
VDGFVRLQHAAGRLPVTVIKTAHREDLAELVPYDRGHGNGMHLARIHTATLPTGEPSLLRVSNVTRRAFVLAARQGALREVIQTPVRAPASQSLRRAPLA